MDEYIEREALLQDIGETVVFTVRKGTPFPNAEMRGANKVIDRVKSAPTADVVKVVRCKDCKHAKLDIFEKGLVICRRSVLKNGQLSPFNWETRADDFCSYGELKEREG